VVGGVVLGKVGAQGARGDQVGALCFSGSGRVPVHDRVAVGSKDRLFGGRCLAVIWTAGFRSMTNNSSVLPVDYPSQSNRQARVGGELGYCDADQLTDPVGRGGLVQVRPRPSGQPPAVSPSLLSFPLTSAPSACWIRLNSASESRHAVAASSRRPAARQVSPIRLSVAASS
jgi:hypothetical protein